MLHSEYWHLILKNENRIIHNSDRKYRYHCKSLESMGEEKNYSSWYYAREFNVFERNLDAINQTSYNKVIGTTKTFFDNGPFIDSSELNRIESATLRLYEIGQNHKKTLPRLSVRLGSLKGVK